MDVILPDGTTIKDVPDGTSKADLITKLHANGYDVNKLILQQMQADRKQSDANLIGGLIRGAGSFGATLARPFESKEENDARRARVDENMQTLLGADPNSTLYKGSKFASELAGTAGVGGLLGQGVARLAPTAAPAIEAVTTSGMGSGLAKTLPKSAGLGEKAIALAKEVGLRSAGGAITGGATAGLINPEDAGKGVLIGGALPVAVQGAGALGGWISGKYTQAKNAVANRLAEALGIHDAQGVTDTANALRSAQALVPGNPPTVSQALNNNPGASTLEDIVHDSTVNNALRNARQAAGPARLNALERVAPTGVTGSAEAKTDLGNAISDVVIPGEKAASTAVKTKYADPAFEAVRLTPPVDEMRAIRDKYLGKGTFGQGSRASEALDVAISLAEKPGAPQTVMQRVKGENGIFHMVPTEVPGPAQPRLSTWQELQDLRSSLGGAAEKAKNPMLGKNKKEYAALVGMQSALDDRINQAAAGIGLKPGEVFPDAAHTAWIEANAAHAGKMEKYHTGPQAAIFRTGANGEPLVQGDQITQKFWSPRAGLANRVDSFNRLVKGNPELLDEFKSMITTEAGDTVKASGDLTSKYQKWLSKRLPGLRKVFSPDDVRLLENIGEDITRENHAASLGAPRGSKTYQNAANAMKLGLLDSPAADWAAHKIPFGGLGLAYGRDKARSSVANKLADLMSNPDEAANALEKLGIGNVPKQKAPSELLKILSKTAPVMAAQGD